MYCIPRPLAKKFIKYLREGKITPDKLVAMSSEERRNLFSEIVGPEDAKEMNAALESKLILKDQKRGMVTWLKGVTGLKEPARKDIASKIEKLGEVLTPENERAFLEDLASKRLGADVSLDEAKHIVDLTKQIRDAKESGGDHGHPTVELRNYVSDLKHAAQPSVLQRIKKLDIGGLASGIAGSAKGINASLDNSAIFRQGWKTLFTNPIIWQKNARQSFVDLVRQFGGKKVIDEVQAGIINRPNYPLMEKAKLDVGTKEEQFPTHLPAKIPILGRVYKASEAAYTGFVYRMRADIFDKMVQIAKDTGADINDKGELESIGKFVNSLTGRGHLGKLERAASTVNNFFFSPRFLKSNIDFLTAHQFQKGVSPLVRKQAAQNLGKAVLGTAAILTIANFISPGSVELDPRSPNLGKIKVGKTTFDVSGGMGSILTLAARLVPTRHNGKWGFFSKSGNTGKVNELNSGKYGSQTVADVLQGFAEGKLSPAASVFRDIWLEGRDYNGNKPTVLGESRNLFTPLPIQNATQLYQAKDAPVLAGIIADALGVSVNAPNPPRKK